MNLQEEVERWIETFKSGLCTKEDVHNAICDLMMVLFEKEEEA